MKRPLFILSVCAAVLMPLHPAYSAGLADSVAGRLAHWSARLESSLDSARLDVHAAQLDFAVTTLATLRSTEAVLRKKPALAQAPLMMRSCSLSVEAALTQLQAARRQLTVEGLQAAVNASLAELTAVHDSIHSLQKLHALRLKADLDEQHRKSRKLREEADRKFTELQSTLIQVKQDARGTIISMSDILFDIGKATLTSDLQTSLAKIAGILSVFKDSRVIVEGHTDNQGSEGYNMELSQKRASNVMNFLIEQGVDPHRLKAVGFGFSRPIADNESREGRQKNRRVDLVIQDHDPHTSSPD